MNIEKVIPVLRIFDYKKAIEFYIDWLGFKINWEHTFDKNSPVYMEIEKDGLTLHLSEHHGDGTPGTNVFVWKPGLEKTFYSALAVTVIDPFQNRIIFNEKTGDE